MKPFDSAILGALERETPERFVSLVRLRWPEIKAAIERGHSIKAVHDRFVKAGVAISYRLFAMYVGQLRREGQNRTASAPAAQLGSSLRLADDNVALIQAPKRRLFGARAAAHYLGIDQRTLKRITNEGTLGGRLLGTRRVYRLEDLDAYIDSLPKISLKAS